MQPILSITIPTYNRAYLLENTLAMLCRQIDTENLHNEVEIVISDNCSSDNTSQVVNAFTAQSRYKIIYNRNRENVGVIRNILKLVELSTADYWMFYGDDDIIPEGALKKLVEVFKKNINYDAFMFKWPPPFDRFCRHLTRDTDFSFDELASGYFYYIGNAGIFAVKTNKAKDVVEQYSNDLINTCWPQTIIVFLSVYMSYNRKIRFVNLVSAIPPHEALVSSNSYYLFETSIYAMIRTALSIEAATGEQIVVPAMKTVPVIQDFDDLKTEILENYCFYDLPKQSQDFKRAVKDAHQAIPAKYRREIDELYKHVSQPLFFLKVRFYISYFKRLKFSTLNTSFINKLKIASPFGFKAMVQQKQRRIAEGKKTLKKTDVQSDSGYF